MLRLVILCVLASAIAACRPAGANPTPPEDEAARTTGATEVAADTDTNQKARRNVTPRKPIFSKSGYDVTPLSDERVAELARKLDPEVYKVTQKSGTEAPFCGNLLNNKKDGAYYCVVCGLPLFSSAHKFDSGTGWPSFYRTFDPDHVKQRMDRSHGMVRTEINCARCGAHLGHVFDDGPKPTGERHCLNSAALKFHEKGAQLPPESLPNSPDTQPSALRSRSNSVGTGASTEERSMTAANQASRTETAYFAGGCFWGIEHYFQQGPGVLDAQSGYMQGRLENPTYKQVCAGDTGHAETVKVVYDPQKITYRRLLEAFFKMHDPTQVNRQGPDVGEQYRSGIWYTSEEQKKEAEQFVREQASSGKYKGRKIATQVEPAGKFFAAEDYHQDYIEKTGQACHVANPW